MTYRVFGRVVVFTDNLVLIEVLPLVNASADGMLLHRVEVDVLLPDALMPAMAIQQAWEEEEQFVVVETAIPLQVTQENEAYRADCQALTFRSLTHEEVQALHQLRRDRKAAWKASRGSQRSGQ